MESWKKMEMLADVLDVGIEELRGDMKLNALEQWDSMTKMAVIVMMEDEFGKKLTSSQIREFETVQDVLNFME